MTRGGALTYSKCVAEGPDDLQVHRPYTQRHTNHACSRNCAATESDTHLAMPYCGMATTQLLLVGGRPGWIALKHLCHWVCNRAGEPAQIERGMPDHLAKDKGTLNVHQAELLGALACGRSNGCVQGCLAAATAATSPHLCHPQRSTAAR
jgi:hypothetical protein